jgi:hypothetical protein
MRAQAEPKGEVMRGPIYPSNDSPAKQFLDVMLRNELYRHHQYLQAPGNARLTELADFLIQLGWPVKHIDLLNPTHDPAVPLVRVYYIGEYSLANMTGEA